MNPDEWEDEDTGVHDVGAEQVRRAIVESLDAITEDMKRRDPRRE